MKWQFAHNVQGHKKYIICNADEGDPGAFMDRSVQWRFFLSIYSHPVIPTVMSAV